MTIRFGSLSKIRRFPDHARDPALIAMGVSGFFYARDLLLDQWREAAILKLQRAAHEIDMRLGRIKESIQIFHETPAICMMRHFMRGRWSIFPGRKA